jgi:Glycosyltransferase family 87
VGVDRQSLDAGSPAFKCVAAATALVGILVLARTLHDYRDRYRRTDFETYYSWSLEFRLGGRPWIPGGAPSFRSPPGMPHAMSCNYPPAFLFFFSPLTLLSQVTAYWVWQGLMIAALVLAICLFLRELGPPSHFSVYFLAIGAALLFPETSSTLYEAQPAFLLLLLFAGAWIFDRRGRPIPAAFLLAAAALLKLYPAAAGGYFLFRRRWSVVAWSIAFGASGLLIDFNSQVSFLRSLPAWMNEYWPWSPVAVGVMQNIWSVLSRFFGASAPVAIAFPIAIAADAALVAAAIAVTIADGRTKELDCLSLGLWIAAALMMSPIAWSHELPLMFPILIAVAAGIVRGLPVRPAGPILIAAGLLAIIVAHFSTPVRYLHTLFIAALAIYSAGYLIGSGWIEFSRSSPRQQSEAIRG